MPVQSDPLTPTLADVQNVNLTPSGALLANDEADDYEGDEGEQGYHPPLHDYQHGSDWHDPNSGWYYQLPQLYPLPDPEVQSAFDQERYAA